jgi:hypothetical protein
MLHTYVDKLSARRYSSLGATNYKPGNDVSNPTVSLEGGFGFDPDDQIKMPPPLSDINHGGDEPRRWSEP